MDRLSALRNWGRREVRAASGIVEGTLLGTSLTASPPLSLFIHSLTHLFIPQPNRLPHPDCPSPKVWRFPAGPRRGQPLSPPSLVCNCSGPQRPRRQRGAVPARLSRTRAPGLSRSGALGPVFQPGDLTQSRFGRKESSCTRARGKEAGQAGGGVSGDSKNCGLCSLRSSVLREGLFREDRGSE